jgi:hypothetical protein
LFSLAGTARRNDGSAVDHSLRRPHASAQNAWMMPKLEAMPSPVALPFLILLSHTYQDVWENTQ